MKESKISNSSNNSLIIIIPLLKVPVYTKILPLLKIEGNQTYQILLKITEIKYNYNWDIS